MLLSLYASCAEIGGEVGRHLRHALLWEHLLSWLPAWLLRLDEVAPEPYVAWGHLLRVALLEEAKELGPPVALPLHLRMAPPVEGLASLLAAVRSGVLLTRADLGRAARTVGLGLRQGERRYALDALLAQEPGAVLGWISNEARRQARLYRLLPGQWQAVSEHWADRADSTMSQVSELASSVTVP